jgi:hypothetical protein
MNPKRKKNQYGLTRFNRAPESMLEQAYITLANPILGAKEKLRLGLVVSYLRGTYDLLRFVETENECRGRALDEIETVSKQLKAGKIDEKEAAKQIAFWTREAKNWRSAKSFGVVTKDIAELDPSWTEKVPKTVHPDDL